MRYPTLHKERRDRTVRRRRDGWPKLSGIMLPAAILLFLLPVHAAASENPDELYQQGRYAEAEKIYSQKDMDNPKDLRYRYNRGCAAYQGGDYKGALAAFTSVSKRSEQTDVRFKAEYNLGNSAYKLEDFASAAQFFKQALALNPENEDAQYNLELTLRKIKEKQEQEQKQKQEQKDQQNDQQKDQQKSQQKDNSQQGQDKKDSQTDNREKQEDQEKQKDQKQSQEKQQNQDKSREEQGEPQKQDSDQQQRNQQQSAPQDRSSQKNKEKEPDLSGELKPREQQSPPEQMEQQQQPSQEAQLDKKKAEALLDNIHEDRTRFLLRQVPPDKRQGAPSGKDW